MPQPNKEPPRAPNPTPTGFEGSSVVIGNPNNSIPEPSISVLIRPRKSKYESSSCKQQKKPYCAPNLGLRNLWLYLMLMGVPLLCLGMFTLIKSETFRRTKLVDYTDCESIKDPGTKCSDFIIKNPKSTCVCHQSFKIRKHLIGKIILSYELEEFHQNMRHYVLSKDENQLRGKIFDEKGKPLQVDKNCKPFDEVYDSKTKKRKTIYPCGRIANALFSDDVILISPFNTNVPLEPISPYIGDFEKPGSFRKPSVALNDAKFTDNFVKPKAWSDEVWNNFVQNNGVQGYDFIRWSRTSAFSTFRNQYRVFDGSLSQCKTEGVTHGLCEGTYTFKINYRFDVASFKGRKKFMLSSVNFISDENHFILISLLVVGSILTGLFIPLGLGSLINRTTELKIKALEAYSQQQEGVQEAEAEPQPPQRPQIQGESRQGQGEQAGEVKYVTLPLPKKHHIPT